MNDDITLVASDNAVTRRERRRQSRYRESVLGIDPGSHGDRPLGSLLPAGDERSNFLSDEAATYAQARAGIVRSEGGQLERNRLFSNMLSSMPLAFNVFGHLRAHPVAACSVLSRLTGRTILLLDDVSVGARSISGIECEWAPDPRTHLQDGTAFDAVAATRTEDGRRLLIAVEVKYIDTFSRDAKDETGKKDDKYRHICRDFGMAEGAFDALSGQATRQLLRNVLLTESVRRGGRQGEALFDDAVTLVLARDDDQAARRAVDLVGAQRGRMRTTVHFTGHGQLADAAAGVPELQPWAGAFRRRYLDD